jgi:hypothetical protein
MKVVLEYDGSGFAGWQQQARGRTVEAELKRALRELTGKEHTVYAAGRTDAGAHAEGQVVNFKFEGRITPSRLAAALNARPPRWFRMTSTLVIRRGGGATATDTSTVRRGRLWTGPAAGTSASGWTSRPCRRRRGR